LGAVAYVNEAKHRSPGFCYAAMLRLRHKNHAFMSSMFPFADLFIRILKVRSAATILWFVMRTAISGAFPLAIIMLIWLGLSGSSRESFERVRLTLNEAERVLHSRLGWLFRSSPDPVKLGGGLDKRKRHPKAIKEKVVVQKAKEEAPAKAPKPAQENQPDKRLKETKENPPVPASPAASQTQPEEPAQASPTARPPPPPTWTEAQIEAAGKECDKRIAGLGALYERVPAFREGAEGECGAPAPIRLRGFQYPDAPEVLFPSQPLMTCRLAEALRQWLDKSVQPAAESLLHSPVVKITDLSSNRCRFVYNSKGEKISEHAVANAVDIGGFETARGDKISVLDGWNSTDAPQRLFLHEVHNGACKIFGTILGPEANADHKNHFHLDMKERRHPLCDFTPEQLIARAKKQAQQAAQNEVPAKPPAATAETKSPPAPQGAIAPQKSAEKPSGNKGP
jgi:hypothetical protein